MKRKTKANPESPDIVLHTGDVFTQLGLSEPGEQLRKSLVLEFINNVIKERGLDQSAAIKLLKLDQGDASRLMTGKISRFSLDRLLTLVDRLGVAVRFEQSRDTNDNLVVTIRQVEHV